MAKKDLIKLLEDLSPDDLANVEAYVKNVIRYNNALNAKEEALVNELGYNPTSHIEDHEWEAMLKRNQMSLEKEAK